MINTSNDVIRSKNDEKIGINYDNDYTNYLNNLQMIKEAKEHFIKTGEIRDYVRPEIAASWKRCIEYGLDPYIFERHHLSEQEFERLCKENKFLINITSSIIQSVCKVLNHINFIMLLTDNIGNILYMSDNRFYEDGFTSGTLSLGARWYEEYVGTNAVSLALLHNKNITTNDAEHFFIQHERASCSTALIHDGNNKIIGTITITYYRDIYDSLSEHKLITSMAIITADLIEQNLKSERNNHTMHSSFENVSEGILILDKNFNVVFANNSFLRIINITKKDLHYVNIHEIFQDINLNSILSKDSKPHITINETTLRYKRKSVQVNMHIYTYHQTKMVDGIIILCRDIRDIIKLSQEYTEKSPKFTFDSIITQDENMINIINSAKQISTLNQPVLVEGASGTGKELFAQSIHNASYRKNGPFIAVNCAALPMELVESELFGYEKGSFTGALSTGKPGKFELAEGGTIFLDEIGELPLNMQGKLLRVLDSYKIARIGGKTEKSLDIRVVAATNRDLKKEVQNKNFREDLYYRLNVLYFKLPALANRRIDIPLLVEYFLDRLNLENPDKCISMNNDTIKLLSMYNWPGNIRELQNCIYRAYYICKDSLITPKHLPASIQESINNTNCDLTLLDIREYAERTLIVDALKQSKGKVIVACRKTGIPKTTMYRKIKIYNIYPSEYL